MSNAETIVFYILSLISVFSAFSAIFSEKISSAVMCAFMCFLSVGFLFFALELPILGSVHILMCSVALIVLFSVLYCLTVKNDKIQNLYSNFNFQKVLISLFMVCLTVFLIAIFIKFGTFFTDGISESCIMPSTKDISIEMYINYVFPFVFTGLFFLSAILGLGFLTSDIRSKQGRDN